MNTSNTNGIESVDPLHVQLRHYLIGFGKRDPIALMEMKKTLHWPELANAVMVRRSTTFLNVLPDNILHDIALGRIDFLKEVEVVALNFAPPEMPSNPAAESFVPSTELEAALSDIAKRRLFVETLEERRSDSLDFHSVGVVGLRKALLEAYTLGVRTG